MKRLLAALMLLALTVSICLIGGAAVSDIQSTAASKLKLCEENIEAENINAAADIASQLREYWRSKRTLLSVFVNHSRYEDTALALEELHSSLISNSEEDALSACRSAYHMLNEIAFEQQLRLDHIL